MSLFLILMTLIGEVEEEEEEEEDGRGNCSGCVFKTLENGSDGLMVLMV